MSENKISQILRNFQNEISDLQATVVVGSDGLVIGELLRDSRVDMELVGAQMALLMTLVKRAATKLGATAQENLLATENGYLLTILLGDGQFLHGALIPKDGGSLGMTRLAMREFAPAIEQAIKSL